MATRFIPQYEPVMTHDYAKSVYSQIVSGWIGPGKKTEEFEKKICELTGKKYCIATTSGTTAIILALHGLNLPKDSTILFPAYTFLAGANAAKSMGYNIQLVDVDTKTLSMSPKALAKKLSGSDTYQALIYVNHNGYYGPEVEEIKQLCNLYGIRMIEDSSQAIGMTPAGTVGDVGIYSFSVPKLITTGQGGALFTDDEYIYRLAKQYQDHGDNWRKDKIHYKIGINLKFDDIHAALGLEQLNALDVLLEQRKKVFDTYKKYLNNPNRIITFGFDSTWMVIYESFGKPSENSDKIRQALMENNIQSVKYYRPINCNPPFYDYNTYQNAEKIYEDTLYLPSGLNLSEEEIKEICEIINNFY